MSKTKSIWPRMALTGFEAEYDGKMGCWKIPICKRVGKQIDLSCVLALAVSTKKEGVDVCRARADAIVALGEKEKK